MLRNWITLAAGAGAAILALSDVSQASQPKPWQTGFQPAASPVMERIESFHSWLLVLITIICLLVFALLVWTMIRYNQRR